MKNEIHPDAQRPNHDSAIEARRRIIAKTIGKIVAFDYVLENGQGEIQPSPTMKDRVAGCNQTETS